MMVLCGWHPSRLGGRAQVNGIVMIWCTWLALCFTSVTRSRRIGYDVLSMMVRSTFHLPVLLVPRGYPWFLLVCCPDSSHARGEASMSLQPELRGTATSRTGISGVGMPVLTTAIFVSGQRRHAVPRSSVCWYSAQTILLVFLVIPVYVILVGGRHRCENIEYPCVPPPGDKTR